MSIMKMCSAFTAVVGTRWNKHLSGCSSDAIAAVQHFGGFNIESRRK